MFIRSLAIRRFRRLAEFEWTPRPGINCLIGPADAGKSTVLAAISLLLSPTPVSAASEFDYHRRAVDDGFEVTAVLGGLTEEVKGALRIPVVQGWLNGELRPLPDEDGAEAVLVARVTGTPQLEVRHELIPPSGEPVAFTAALRQMLLLARVSGEERAARELRLTQGSLLVRHLRGVDLRRTLAKALASASVSLELPGEATEALGTLRSLFEKAGLPADLHLGLTAPPGSPVSGLVSLVVGADSAEAIPVAYSGTGTRQLALFWLTAALMKEEPVIIFDEPESGLEPYRQRVLIAELRRLIGTGGQAFVTTHSPSVLGTLSASELWRLTPGGKPIDLGIPAIEKIQARSSDALLSALPVLCEGDTEAGILQILLTHVAKADGVSVDAAGISLVPCNGQPSILDEAKALLGAGISCGLFVDAETKHSGRRQSLAAESGCAFACWSGVRNIEEALGRWLPAEQLYELIAIAADHNGRDLVSLFQEIGEAAGKPGKTRPQELAPELGEQAVRTAITAAMLKGGWFKTLEGGARLGRALLNFGVPEPILSHVSSFWTRLHQVLQA